MWWCALDQRLKKEFLTRFYAQTYGGQPSQALLQPPLTLSLTPLPSPYLRATTPLSWLEPFIGSRFFTGI